MSDEQPESSAQQKVAAAMLKDALAYAKRIGDVDMKPRAVTLDIDGLKYTSAKWPASRGLEIWALTSAIFGPLLRMVSTGQGSITIDAIMSVSDRAAHHGLMPLVKDLLSDMQVNERAGMKDDAGPVLDSFDDHFAGEYAHLLKVCVFAIAHNIRGPTRGGS